MTNVTLAQRAGISAPPCLRRVRALEEAGFIRGYHADLDGERIGFEVTFFALVGLDSQSESVLSAFENDMAASCRSPRTSRTIPASPRSFRARG